MKISAGKGMYPSGCRGSCRAVTEKNDVNHAPGQVRSGRAVIDRIRAGNDMAEVQPQGSRSTAQELSAGDQQTGPQPGRLRRRFMAAVALSRKKGWWCPQSPPNPSLASIVRFTGNLQGKLLIPGMISQFGWPTAQRSRGFGDGFPCSEEQGNCWIASGNIDQVS